ncbi:MAG: hypothetical protein GY744_04035 [Gammaproteobacteria bacterium]|nr:hypothetical protein [Gammaproteobacteria bacterium]
MKFLPVSLLLVFGSSSVYSAEVEKLTNIDRPVDSDNELSYIISGGVSAFECMVGVEVKKASHSVGLGICGQLSYRYYSNPYNDSFLYGLYTGYSSGYHQYEDKKEIDGVKYEDKKGIFAGVGIGYRWQKPSGWNTTLSMAIHYMEEEYSNVGQPKEKQTSVILFPGITVGYQF